MPSMDYLAREARHLFFAMAVAALVAVGIELSQLDTEATGAQVFTVGLLVSVVRSAITAAAVTFANYMQKRKPPV